MGFNPRTPCGVRPGSMIVSVSPVGFQSTHSLRSATKTPSYFVYDDYVSIHALLAECDYTQPACPPRSGVSIHALLAECDILPTGEIAPLVKFQSTHSLRSATGAGWSRLNPLIRFQSTHSLRSATYSCLELVEAAEVSIHALLAECDSGGNGRALTDESFNPRTPCGVRPSLSYHSKLCTTFQSTHSLRSATDKLDKSWDQSIVSIHALLAECDASASRYSSISHSFNPRTPCGVRPTAPKKKESFFGFNPRTPCGVRRFDAYIMSVYDGFQSTHSLRSATLMVRTFNRLCKVSIHALLAECDRGYHGFRGLSSSFNPRTPCGVRPGGLFPAGRTSRFQSTHSLRSATLKLLILDVSGNVSIHALLAECDRTAKWRSPWWTSFNPRTPCGVRLPVFVWNDVYGWFQSTHSLRSATWSTRHLA